MRQRLGLDRLGFRQRRGESLETVANTRSDRLLGRGSAALDGTLGAAQCVRRRERFDAPDQLMDRWQRSVFRLLLRA